ncbi:conserved unknown protein [Ectocarpus siliculosus]|uniref:Fe-S oxidoreductase n=1 Tax=Ectocarpus siliculosus TaxID=2880 RepID=D7FPQ5_ECTSI|nr:conserved unknown protein [Ectocarpus siliculosus]|eukprot:CBJ30512.1 conserved unknown protein [Ectocarpus siliculosus]
MVAIAFAMNLLSLSTPRSASRQAYRWGRRWAAPQVRMSSDQTQGPAPITPDFVTPVEVAGIRLSKPAKAPARSKKWVGLEGLDERTAGSLIPETLQGMEKDEEFQLTAAKLKQMGQKKLTLEEKKIRRRALKDRNLPSFQQHVQEQGIKINRESSTIFQLNIGLFCNQACSHCHVESSPQRKEMVSKEVAERCIEIIKNSPTVKTLDITGGAPELNDHFRYMVEEGRALGLDVIDRCNLTVLQEPGQEDLAEFLAKNKVHVVASLPCYSPKNVNMQRGSGVFDRSIKGLMMLNALGYGQPNSGLKLDLVYNPIGGFLPPEQVALEVKYKEELNEAFGIKFNNLFTITNMPIKRFADFLYRRGELQEYMELLVRNFNTAACSGLMCKDTINVGWDGRVFDCDFNQQLGLGMGTAGTNAGASEKLLAVKEGYSIFDVDSVDDMQTTDIVLESHCYGCTAGNGSSCQGATA